MLRKKYRGISLALALLMLVAVTAACGGGGTAGTTTAAAAAATTAAAAAGTTAEEATTAAAEGTTAADTTAAATTAAASADGGATPVESAYDTHIVISQTVLDAEKTGNTERDKWFYEKFNVEFNYIPVTWGDWFEKVRAMVAGDDIPDILWWDMKINHTAEYRGWAQQGAFREITGLENHPIMNELSTSLMSMEKMMRVDGKLYGWTISRSNPEWLQDAYYPMYAYRRDWAKAIGMYKEGDIYTYDEIFAMIDAVKEQDPGGNGVGNTFGMTSETWAFPGVFMETLGYGKDRSAYIKTDNGYEPYFTTDSWRQELKFVANMYRNGYIWKDQMVVSGSEGLDNFKAGRAFMYLGNNSPGWFGGQYATWLESGVITSTEDLAPMIAVSPVDDKTFTLTQTEDYWTVANLAYHVDDEKYARILDMWEWLAGEEGRAFRIAGIEGKDYERVSPTEIKILWDKDASGNWVSPYKDTANNYATPPAAVPGPNEGTNMIGEEAFSEIHEFMQTSPDYFVNKLDWDLNTFAGEQYSQFGGFGSDVTAFIKTVLAESQDVDAMVDSWLAEMEPRWRPVADERNAELG